MVKQEYNHYSQVLEWGRTQKHIALIIAIVGTSLIAPTVFIHWLAALSFPMTIIGWIMYGVFD